MVTFKKKFQGHTLKNTACIVKYVHINLVLPNKTTGRLM